MTLQKRRSKSSQSSLKRILIGFASDDDWFEYRLEHHPEFLRPTVRLILSMKRAKNRKPGNRPQDVSLCALCWKDKTCTSNG